MRSESARMSSAEEARFRVQAPNSQPRAIKVVALDEKSAEVLARLADGPWTRATFFKASAGADAPLLDLSGAPRDLKHEVDTADLVVMVAAPGGGAAMAAIIGQACSDKRVMTTSLVIGAASAPEPEVSKTLAQLRPWSLMVVIANPEDYIDDMLVALRAA